jgi:hypothetical protein
LADTNGSSAQTAWYNTSICYEVYSSGTAQVKDINGNTVSVSTGVTASFHNLSVLKGSAVT